MSNNLKRKLACRPQESDSEGFEPETPKIARKATIVNASTILFQPKKTTSDAGLAHGSVSEPALDLPGLLDFSNISTQADISLRFEQIASMLLHRFYLIVTAGGTQTEFQFLELEFYLQKSDCHEDPFTHGSEDQKRSCQWYFHRAPRRSGDSAPSRTTAAGYRGGTRKGLDLTVGAPATQTSHFFLKPGLVDVRGGILLRSVRRLSDSKVISGPSLLVDEILRLSGAPNIAELVTTIWGGDISAFPSSSKERSVSPIASLRLQRIHPPSEMKCTQIYRSPRIGLDLSHPDLTVDTPLTHPRCVYVSKLYRYFVHPHLLTANGRGQTFLGAYQACVDSRLFEEDGSLCTELVKLTGLKAATVKKYLEEYRHGFKKGVLRSFMGAAGKGSSASPTTFLRMMGTLRRLQSDDIKPGSK